MSIEAMKQALDALDNGKRVRACEGGTAYQPDLEDNAIKSLRQAIEQAEKQDADEWYEKALWGEKQKPVMWMDAHDFKRLYKEGTIDCDAKLHEELDEIPLYTAPPQREWVGLSRGEKLGIIDRHTMRSYDDQQDMLFAIMADANDLLKNKNAPGWQSVSNPTEYLDELRGGEAT